MFVANDIAPDEEEDGRGARIYRDRLAQGVFSSMCRDGDGRAAMGATMADDGRRDCGAADTMWRGEPHRGRSVESHLAFVDRIVDHVGAVSVVDARKTRLKAGYAAKT